ncbi:hypothetical protein KFK09_009515 [Dendrobium nobile]|uniref:Pentatricopeptide repeat-containing protein n=1 Tax=Dendrobium nobile TaxID=94219 RepID=A0A8T3BJM5_DENNO|nr:hypothetical protein KFK09_009515 [Dendrobium nobile]
MCFAYLLRRCSSLRKLQAAHAVATTTGITFLHPAANLTSLLQTLTLLRPLPPPTISLPYALSLFHFLPNSTSTLAHNLLIRLFLSVVPSSPLPAIHLFSRLRRLSLPPDLHSFPLALSASSRLRLLPLGRAFHAQSLRFGFSSNLFVRNALISLYTSCSSLPDAENIFLDNNHAIDIVSYNALIHGYAKAGNLQNAQQLFNQMLQRDAISYGTMIVAYSHFGQHSDALQLFDQMQSDGFKPDNVALASALSSCAHMGQLNRGKAIHDYIRRNRDELSVSLLTGLIDMYAKCGEINIALNLFNGSSSRNLFTWNSIIVGLAMHGYGTLSLDYFDKMRAARVKPDGITILGVLVACSHSGFVETARRMFCDMERVYGVRIELKHYGCMADLFGRAGMIEEVMEMIEEMPMKGDGYVWGSVLSSCQIHRGNVEVAEVAARKLLEIDPGDTGVYSIIARIYADARRWEDVQRIQRIMDAIKVKKNIGFSLVHLPGNV